MLNSKNKYKPAVATIFIAFAIFIFSCKKDKEVIVIDLAKISFNEISSQSEINIQLVELSFEYIKYWNNCIQLMYGLGNIYCG